MFHQLAAALQYADAQLTAEEIADALWLANYMPASDSNAAGATGSNQKNVISEPVADADVTEPIQPQPEAEQTVPEPAGSDLYLYRERTDSAEGLQKGSLFRSPAAFALPDPLGLGRALRPFKRRVPSRTVFTLNEEETARRVAETKLWLPVLSAASTRWLEVALVIDEASSMAIWRQTLIELRLLLEREGAFRTVRTWGLVTDAPDGKARLYAGTARVGRRECNPHELIDPGGRRLILVVTDGVSPAWDKKNGSVATMLASWGRSTPVTIIQVLPQHFWRRTAALRAAVQVRLHALTPGPPNQQLAARPVYRWDAKEASTGVKVPVVTLEPRSLLNWARAIARAEDIWIPGYVFNPNAAQDNGNINAPAPSKPEVTSLSAQERVNRFRASASPTAYKLAGLLSTVPVSLPIIRLIQQTMLKESRQMHVAEVLLGGLLKEVPPAQATGNPDYIEYEFIDGVRDLLFDSLRTNEAVETIETLSNFIEKRLGQSSDFQASLPNPYGTETIAINKEARRFARVAASVLYRLGGNYAQLAKSYEEVADEIDGQAPEPPIVDIKSPVASQDQDKIDRQTPEPPESPADQVQNNQFGTTEKIEESAAKVAEPQIPAHAEQESIAEEEDIAGKPTDLQSVEESDKAQTFSISPTRRVLLLTALRVEYTAVRAHLSNLREEVWRGAIYERGDFNVERGLWDVGLVSMGMGSVNAAAEADRAIDYFQPDMVLLVGIAGGFKDVKIGDVVVANKVYGYESGKVEGDRFIPRPDVGESSYTLLRRARAEARREDWLHRIHSVQPGESTPAVFIGPIASGEKVISSMRSDIYQFLSTYYGDTLAVDMEGRGVLRATRAHEQVQALIIRGISDLINSPRQADEGFQKVAADHASAFAFEVLAKLAADEPSQSRQTQPDDAQLESRVTTVAPPSITRLKKPVEVFYSYTHSDEELRQGLEKHLAILEIKGLITSWYDRNITAGSDWEQEINTHLNKAQVILLLVSPSFLASRYAYNVEMQRALERYEAREALIIPVILRPCAWQATPLGKLSVLPVNGKPITMWASRDEAFANVAQNILRAIESFVNSSILDQLIETVKEQMQPQARAIATANTLQQLSPLIPDDVTLADLVVGWRALAQPSQQEEAPAISQRRVTCGELASMASQLTTEQGSLVQAIKTWEQWFTSFEDSNDPRQAAMAKTFARELMELQKEQRNADQKQDTNISWTHLQQISLQDKLQLVDKLLACPTMSDRRSRDTMLGLLDRQITESITRSSIERVDVMNIVNACLNFPDGLKDLIQIVGYFEGDSLPMQALKMFLEAISIPIVISREDPSTAASVITGKQMTSDYDVLFIYNYEDSDKVHKIAEQLEQRGILPWFGILPQLTEEERSGQLVMQEIEEQIKQIKAVAVFIGKGGIESEGNMLLYGILSDLMSRNIPVIPVILDNAPEGTQLPPYLQMLSRVDFRRQVPAPMDQLIWGITGERQREL